MIIQPNDQDHPYFGVVTNFFTKQFPGSNPCNLTSVMEAVSAEIIGTKQHRYGPTPTPEAQVSIREVVTDSIKAGVPIPIITPWGGRKQADTGADIADLMALNQITGLMTRVACHYKPGVEARIRLEAFTDQTLYNSRRQQDVDQSNRYMDQIRSINRAMGNKISVISESNLVSRETFRDKATANSAPLLTALGMTEAKRAAYLAKNLPDWSGVITDDQIAYYYRTYSRFYPAGSVGNEADQDNEYRLARYFSRSLARYQLGVTGASDWTKYITLALVSTPWGRTGRRVYYRTMPERFTNQHFAPWIGRGYVRINGNQATPAIMGQSDQIPLEPMTVTIKGNDVSVEIEADYVVEG